MKTDNSIVSTNVESLKDAINFYYPFEKLDNYIIDAERSAFATGANWQKEQYKPLIESHAELLDIVKTIAFWFSNEANYPIGTNGYNIYKKSQAAIENANNIIK